MKISGGGRTSGLEITVFLSNEQKQRFVACSLYKKSESLNLESFLQDSSKTTYIILYPESLLLQVTSLGVLKRRLTLRPTRCSWHKQVMGFSGRDLCFVCLVILACLVCKLPGVRALTQRIWHERSHARLFLEIGSTFTSYTSVAVSYVYLAFHPSIHPSIQSNPIRSNLV